MVCDVISIPGVVALSPCTLHASLLAAAFLLLLISSLFCSKTVNLEEEELPLLSPTSRSISALHHLMKGVYIFVFSILSTSFFDSVWILSKILKPVGTIPDLFQISIYLLNVVPWALHFRHLLNDELISNKIRFSTKIIAFWGGSFILANIELYHNILYFQNFDKIDKANSDIFVSGNVFTFGARYILITLLTLFTIADIIVSNRTTSRLTEPISSPDRPRHAPSHYANSTKPPTSYAEFKRHFGKLVPFIWPKGQDNLYLQFLVFTSFSILVSGRVVNWYVPTMYKNLVDILGNLDNSSPEPLAVIPWGQILIFVFFRFLQGSVGFLSSLEDFLWIPVGQDITRQISCKMFVHLHSLSLRYHLNRKTGEILRIQDRGVASIVSLLESIFFNIVPNLVDIFVACIYFTLFFDIYFGFVVFTTMTLYIFFTVVVTEWRTRYRRLSNSLENVMEARAVDSLLNFETVKYYSAEDHEARFYSEAVKNYQKADFVSMVSLSMLQNIQNLIIQLGLLVGLILCSRRIVYEKTMTVGDLVLYLSYITQLYGPLNYFGSLYRTTQKNFVDMENMLDLFDEPPDIVDIPNAPPLIANKGEVVFENVSFHYDERSSTLKNVSFKISQGSTCALVGPSGGGKSTILRLLFRFYDVKEGRILIDGQDIKKIQQKSLRSSIGVVPQDTVLFNDTIEYNIRYGRPTASQEDIYQAARDAQIHDKILGFPDGYKTQVGERGLRLSGGEKQRVAIARTFLKNPCIVLLDEATSALDTSTEREIQKALSRVTLGRTTLTIAHRLSTVVNADLILVVKSGEICERGSHSELMGIEGGVYKDMWEKQLQTLDHEGESLVGDQVDLKSKKKLKKIN